MTTFSFMLPTRGRPDGVKKLFDSIVATTSRLSELEVVMVVDDDDLESQAIRDDRLNLKMVVIPRGATMGTLNQTAYDASTGRFVMGMNDDVVLRTPGWDGVVLNAFALHPDDIALIHVNDLLFKERLCCFPVLSRQACDLIGLCPTGYRRYRIDDHIYDIYNMLAYLGHKRLVYLPEVIFEHENFETEGKAAENRFYAQPDRIYVVDKAIMRQDAALFDSNAAERKQAAIKLAQYIDNCRYARLQARQSVETEFRNPERRRHVYDGLVGAIQDPFHYRREDFVKRYEADSLAPERSRRATVAVVSADIRAPHAAECLARIKQHTSNYELVVLDNNRGPDFNHPHEMNRVIQTAETDFLVLMDDDILVEAGWLEGMLGAVDETTGVVLPMHKNQDGEIDYAGAYIDDDSRGTHSHLPDAPDAPRDVQGLCSAIMLIDLRKCGCLRMDEQYAKYFFDLVYGLEVWESGYRVVCTPEVTVTHLCGATQIRGTALATALWERDQVVYIQDWVVTGRFDRLKPQLRQSADLRPLIDLPEQIQRLSAAVDLPSGEFDAEVAELVSQASRYKWFGVHLAGALVKTMQATQDGQPDKAQICRRALASLPELTDYIKDARWREGTLLIETANAKWAIDERRAAIALLEVQANRPETTSLVLFRLSEMLMEAEQWENAIRYLSLLARAFPNDDVVSHKLGLAQFQVGNARAAEASLRRAAMLAPNSAVICNDLGVLYFQTKRLDKCFEQLERAMSIDPAYPDAHLNYAAVKQACGQPEQGARALENFLARQPDAQVAEMLAQLRGEAAVAA